MKFNELLSSHLWISILNICKLRLSVHLLHIYETKKNCWIVLIYNNQLQGAWSSLILLLVVYLSVVGDDQENFLPYIPLKELNYHLVELFHFSRYAFPVKEKKNSCLISFFCKKRKKVVCSFQMKQQTVSHANIWYNLAVLRLYHISIWMVILDVASNECFFLQNGGWNKFKIVAYKKKVYWVDKKL